MTDPGEQNVEEIATRLRSHAIEYGPRVVREVIRAAELYREGQVEAANEIFSVVNDGLSVLIYASHAVASELEPRDESTRANLSQTLLQPLGEIEASHLRSDWIGVADALEYEVAEIISDWVRDAQQTSRLLVGEYEA